MILSFSAVETLFSIRHSIADESALAFRGRLQHFQRSGFPEGINTGKGRRAQYGWAQLFQLAYAFDLVELGQPPEVASRIILENFDDLMLASVAILDTLMLLEISALSPLKSENHKIAAKVWPMTKDSALSDISKLNEFYSGPITIIDPKSTSSFFLKMIPPIVNLKSEEVRNSFEKWGQKVRDLYSDASNSGGGSQID